MSSGRLRRMRQRPPVPGWIALLPQCPGGGKACHASEESARRHRRGLMAKDRDGGGAIKVYVCTRCGLWHVGHGRERANG